MVGARLGVELPVRPLVRQLVETAPVAGCTRDLPLTIEAESGFHFRRRGNALVLAMPEAGAALEPTSPSSTSARRRLARRIAPGTRRGRRPWRAPWAGLYDMTPDAHPIVGPIAEGVYAACGFSGHGFMQAPRWAASSRTSPRRRRRLRPLPVSARSLRGRCLVSGDGDSLTPAGGGNQPGCSLRLAGGAVDLSNGRQAPEQV